MDYVAKVTTEQRWWDLRFPVRRTTEHFMTVEFCKTAKGVLMQVLAWDARNLDRRSKMPKAIRGFSPAVIELK